MGQEPTLRPRITCSFSLPLAAVIAVILSDRFAGSAAMAQVAADKIYLSGIVRDFHQTHPDFQVMPAGGLGNYAGLVDAHLDSSNMPVFLPNGYRVSWPALDSNGNTIAPHMADGAFANPDDGVRLLLVVQNALLLTPQDAAKKLALEAFGHTVSVLDDNSTQSQINSAVAVNDVVFVSEEVDHAALGIKLRDVPIGVISEDKDLSDQEFGFCSKKGNYMGTKINITNNNHDITQGFPLGELALTTEEWNLWNASGTMAPGGLCLAHKIGSGPTPLPVLMVIETGDERYSLGPAPARRVELPWGNHSIDFNTINPAGLLMMRRCVSWGADGNPVGLPCSGYEAGDLPANLDSVPSSAGITSADTFNQYFNDTMGVNVSALNILTMVRQPDDTYLFDDTLDPLYSERGGFYPIDGLLFGNTPAWPSHNHHFTYMLKAQFNYDKNADQFFELATDADAWVFIDTKLAIDLGGIHDVLAQRIDLERLCLVDGETYTLRLFMAQRYAPESVLRIHTDLLFETTEYPAVTWAAD